jgi:hypothetical protein
VANVGMVESRDGAGFAFEAFIELPARAR